MSPEKKQTWAGIAAGVVSTLVLLAFIGLIVIYTGAYNVAASEDHSPLVRWAFTTTLQTSVDGRAEDIAIPEAFTADAVDESLLAHGASDYKAMCQHCHAGPGVRRAKWAEGMLPQPPHLIEEADEWELNEIYWLVNHGIKMSGMPSFGGAHDDETLWRLAVFVKRLPGMTADEYAAFPTTHPH